MTASLARAPHPRAYLKLVPPPKEEERLITIQEFYDLVAEHRLACARHDELAARRAAREIAFQASAFYLRTMQTSEVISSAAL